MDPTAERQLHLTIGSRFENIELVQVVGRRGARRTAALDDDARHWIDLAVREAVANAIKHGNRSGSRRSRSTSTSSSFADAVEIRGRATRAAASIPSAVQDPLAPENRFRADGRGIFYMKRFMDDVDYGFRPERRHGRDAAQASRPRARAAASNDREG